MPVYIEATTVARIIDMVLKQPSVVELIVTDDCSSDGSWDVLQCVAAQNSLVKVFHHDINQGKGATLRTAISHATAPIVLIQDADFVYDPQKYNQLIAPILENKGDVVFGSRFAEVGSHRVLYYWHSLGNKSLTLLSNVATDMETCYKVFRREIIQNNRLGFEPEITAKMAKLRVRILKSLSPTLDERIAKAKINWRDGFRALWCILNAFTNPPSCFPTMDVLTL